MARSGLRGADLRARRGPGASSADLVGFPEDQVATDRIVRSGEPDRVRLVCDAMRADSLKVRSRSWATTSCRGATPGVSQAGAQGIEWIPADELVESVRRIKSPRELDCIRTAGEIVTAALTKQLSRPSSAEPRLISLQPERMSCSAGVGIST